MSELSDTLYLARASRYANPLSGNDRLPIVCGDLTDGSEGTWKLPCIDTVNFVYSFAGHAVLSVANGNVVNIYADGALVDPADYTFDESNDYESKGIIATVTFDADQANKEITARGKGKADGATLIESIIDLVYDVLTVEGDFDAALFEATFKAKAGQIFSAQGYKAAGVIDTDISWWELLKQMMGSFLGSAYLNGTRELALEVDDGTLSQYSYAAIISKADAEPRDARQRLVNLINQCPINYAYNYARGAFARHTDDTAHADLTSQGIYGVRTPSAPYQCYWCRDLTSVQKIQDIIVAKFRNPLWEIEIEDITLNRIHIDNGDVVIYSADFLYDKKGNPLINNFWRVIATDPNMSIGNVRFRLLQTPYYLTTAVLADGTYTADGSILAGGDRDMTIY